MIISFRIFGKIMQILQKLNIEIQGLKLRWHNFIPTSRRKFFALLSLVTLFLSFGLNHLMSTYADQVQSHQVTDLFLDFLPLTDVNFIFFGLRFFGSSVCFFTIFGTPNNCHSYCGHMPFSYQFVPYLSH